MAIKKVYLKKKIEGVVYDIYARTSADAVEFKTGTVADELTRLAASLESVITSNDVDAAVKAGCDELYNKIMGITDGTTVNEAYDTLKEVADYLSTHGSVVNGFTTDISALKATVGNSESGLVKDLADLTAAVEALDYSKVTASETNGNIVVDGAEVTVYTEPETISATKITQDETHRFVTDEQLASFGAAEIKVVSSMPEEASDALYIVLDESVAG